MTLVEFEKSGILMQSVQVIGKISCMCSNNYCVLLQLKPSKLMFKQQTLSTQFLPTNLVKTISTMFIKHI